MKQIPLTQGKFALVDDEDFDFLSQWKWTYHCAGYAYRMIWYPEIKKQKSVLMHRLVTDCPPDMEVDHINHNRLDNTRGNLRVCTRKQNGANLRITSRNKSGFKGVSKNHRTGAWTARIRRNNKSCHIGDFKNIEDAVMAYRLTIALEHGEFACNG